MQAPPASVSKSKKSFEDCGGKAALEAKVVENTSAFSLGVATEDDQPDLRGGIDEIPFAFMATALQSTQHFFEDDGRELIFSRTRLT